MLATPISNSLPIKIGFHFHQNLNAKREREVGGRTLEGEAVRTEEGSGSLRQREAMEATIV